MDENEQLEQHEKERREFLSCLGSAIAGGAAAVAASSVAVAGNGGHPRNDSRQSATGNPRTMIGRNISGHSASMPKNASAACAASRRASRKTMLLPTPHHFRTWVERYVTLEGEDNARIDSQADPVNIEASGRGRRRIDSPIDTRMRRSRRHSSCRSYAITARIRPACRCARPARPTRPRMAWS